MSNAAENPKSFTCSRCHKKGEPNLRTGDLYMCYTCNSERMREYYAQMTWPTKQLRNLKTHEKNKGNNINKWTPWEYIQIFNRCDNRCIISGEESKDKLTIVSSNPDEGLNMNNGIVISKKLNSTRKGKKAYFSMLTAEMIDKYIQ